MITRSVVRIAAVAIVALALGGPALAGGGGFPAVELASAPPGETRIGEMVRVDFMVLSHGLPYDDVQPYLSALHKETKETFREDALKDEAPGSFHVETTFHEAGTWFWEIVLGDWGSTTLPPLTVLTADGKAAPSGALAALSPGVALPAAIHAGACDQLGEVAYPLEDLGTQATEAMGSSRATPVKMSVTVLDVALADLVRGVRSIAIGAPGAAATDAPLVCGEMGGQAAGGVLPFGLHGVNGAEYSGIAVLEATGAQTTVTAYLTANPVAPPASLSAGKTVNVEIAQTAFSPVTIEIAVGDTVTWTNDDPIQHTVSFADMTIADSNVLDQGDTFSHTFDTPGSYSYQCNPHPFMTGTVIVT